MAKFSSIKNLKPAKRYAEALIESSNGNLSIDKIYEDLSLILNTVNENEDLKNFLNFPPVSKADKKDVLSKIFSDKVDKPILNFLFLLNENSRLNILDDIFYVFKEFSDDKKNIQKAFITSAYPLNEAQKEKLIIKLQEKTGKIIEPEFGLEGGLIGGFIIKINDTVIDLSLKKRIENLKKK